MVDQLPSLNAAAAVDNSYRDSILNGSQQLQLLLLNGSSSLTIDSTGEGGTNEPQLNGGDFELLMAWLRSVVGMWVLPILTWIGVFFNCASIGFLRNNEVRLRKSLVGLFIFLNVFDW